jgi:NAD(P)H-dependent FMN reductase
VEELTGGSLSAAGDQVPHPLHAYVSALLTRVGTVQTRLHNKQLRPATAVSAGTAWVSSAATLWAQEFTPRTATYVVNVGDLDDDLADLLRRTPATCTAEEAARWRAKLGGGYGA